MEACLQTTTAWTRTSVGPFASDQFTVPAENCVRGDDRRHSREQATAQSVAQYGEASALAIVETQAPSTEPRLQNAILFSQKRDQICLLTMKPPTHRHNDQRAKSRRSRRSSCGTLRDWRARVTRTDPESLLFSTWSGKPISPNNVQRRWIVPAWEALGLRRVSWLTLRRTYSSWAHEKGVPSKVIAQLMGHAKVDTTLNVYTQVVDGSLRRAADMVGFELFTIVHKPEATSLGHPPKAAARAERGQEI